MGERWRVAILSQIVGMVAPIVGVLRAVGHEPVGVALAPSTDGRPMREPFRTMTLEMVENAPAELDIVIPSRRERLAPLLTALAPDLVVACGFPWKVRADALAVPRLGILNGHNAWLPDYRGPIASAWMMRHGLGEIAVTWHLMDEELDTGPILARARERTSDDASRDAIRDRTRELTLELLGDALRRLASGDRGEPQEGGTYYGFFGDDDVWIDWTRSAREVHDHVRAWWFAFRLDGEAGPLAELDAEIVRVKRTSLTPVDGARRVECADAPLWVVDTEPVDVAAPTVRA